MSMHIRTGSNTPGSSYQGPSYAMAATSGSSVEDSQVGSSRVKAGVSWSATGTIIALIVGFLGFAPEHERVALASTNSQVGTYSDFAWKPTPGSGEYWQEAPVVDDKTLYASSDNSTGAQSGSHGWLGVVAENSALPTAHAVQRFYRGANLLDSQRVTGPNAWLETTAVDAGGPGGARAKYVYAWTYDGVNIVPGSPSNSIALTRTLSGTKTAEYTFVPLPFHFGADATANTWNGGEVNQITGEVAFTTPGNGSSINGGFRMMLFNPATGEYNYSGRIAPETGLDNIFGPYGVDSANGHGTVASDMAFDSNGRAYVLVQNQDAIPNLDLPPDTKGRAVLVRINPGKNGSPWTYTVVNVIKPGPGQPTSGNDYANGLEGVVEGYAIWGSAFYEGYLYAWSDYNAVFVRIDPVTGYAYRVPENSSGPTTQRYWTDLASGQTAIIVDGKVYNDVNGDGVIDENEDHGQSHQQVALYKKDANGNYVLLSTTQTTGSGNYTFMLNARGEYAVRVVQPRVNVGSDASPVYANAVQTYASAATGSSHLNPVAPKCGSNLATLSGACSGNLAVPFVDPNVGAESTWGSGTEELDNMAIYTLINVTSPNEVATADFGVSAAGSWGDAQANFASTGASNGPRFVQGANPALWLGTGPGSYANGANSADSDAHATDDGVAIVAADGSVMPLQDAAMAGGKSYPLRGTVGGSQAGFSTLYGWFSNAVALAANTVTAGPTPTFVATTAGTSAQGAYSPPTVTGLNKMVGRFMVVPTASGVPTATNSTNYYGPNHGSSAANSTYWTVPGELEDYRYYVASALVRVAAESAKVPTSPFTFSLTNTSTTAPSTDVDLVQLASPGVAVRSGAIHAVNAPTNPVIITAAEKPGFALNGSSSCSDTITGAAAAANVDISARTITLTPGAGADVTCKFVYMPLGSLTDSTLAVAKTDQSASNVPANNTGSYTATATVRDSDGVPMSGVTVTLGLYAAPTGGSEVPATTAKLIDAGDNTTNTCVTDGNGVCTVRAVAAVSGTYYVRATIPQGGTATGALAGSPQVAVFSAREADLAKSYYTVTPATETNAVEAGVGAGTITVTLKDSVGLPVTDQALALSGAPEAGSRVSVGAFTHSGGGVYTASWTGKKAGAFDLGVTIGGSALQIEDTTVGTKVGNGKAFVKAGTASANTSQLSVPTAANNATVLADGAAQHTAQVAVRDANNNPVKTGSVTFHYSYTDWAGVAHTGNSGAQQIDPATGVATWSFGSTVAKPWTVTATIAGVTGNVNPPAGVVAGFHAGAVDPDKTVASLQVGPNTAKADGKAVVPVWMMVQDAHDNPLPGQYCGFELTNTANPGAAKFDSAHSGTFAKSGVGPTGDDGRCQVSIRSLYEGSFPVVGVFGGATTAVPVNANFENQPVDSAKSEFSVTPSGTNSTNPATANGTDNYVVTVKLKDASGSIVNNVAVDVYYRLSAGGPEHKLTVTSGANGNPAGTATATIATTVAGGYDVYVKTGSNSIATAPGGSTYTVPVEFVPGAPNGVASFLSDAVGTAKANGAAQLSVTATIKDAFGNFIKNTPVVFALPAGVTSGTANGPGTITIRTDANGVAPLPLAAVKPGTYEITATVNSVTIVTGSPAHATFANDDLSLANSELTLVTSGAKEVQTESHTVAVTLRDAQGNVFTEPRAVTFYAKSPTGTNWVLLGAANTLNGTAALSFTKTESGVWQVRAELQSGSPTGKVGTGTDGTIVNAEFAAGPADVTRTKTTWTGSTGAKLSNNTETHYARVTILDQYGNAATGTVVFELNPTKAAHFTSSTGTGDFGKTLTLTATPTSSTLSVYMASPAVETIDITATSGGVSVVAPAGPATFEFATDAPSVLDSTFVVTPEYPAAKIADGTLANSFTGVVTVKDSSASKLPVPGYDVQFELPPDVRIVEPAPYLTDTKGRVRVHFVSTKANGVVPNDYYTVNALIGSAKVPSVAGDPSAVDQKIKFVAGSVDFTDFSKQFLTVTANGAIADGVATNTVTATLKDKFGNPVRGVDGGEVAFALPGGVTAVGGSTVVPTDANGVATLNVTSEQANTEFVITAAVRQRSVAGWTNITGNSPARMFFVAGQVDALRSVLTVVEAGPKTADGADHYTVNVTLKDANGNRVKVAGTPVHLTFTAPSGTVADVERDITTDADGVASFQFATTTAGSWSVAGLYGGVEVIGSPQTLGFVAGPIDFAVSTFDVTGGVVAADGVKEHRAWAVVTDKDGNPLVGERVTFTLPAGSASILGPVLSDTTLTPGTLPELTVTTDAAGVAEVFVTSNKSGTYPVTAKIGIVAIAGHAVDPLNHDAQFATESPHAEDHTEPSMGEPGINMSPKALYRGDTMFMRGFNFNPGERVSVVCNSATVSLGTFTTETDGQVVVPDWVVPDDFEFGQHICTFTGEVSGPISAPFRVLEPIVVLTGGSVAGGLTPEAGNRGTEMAAYLPRAKRVRKGEQ
jgi:hypothetical protein